MQESEPQEDWTEVLPKLIEIIEEFFKGGNREKD